MAFYNGADDKAGTRWIFSGPKRALVARILVSLFLFADKREELKYALALRQNSVKLFVFFSGGLRQAAHCFGLNHRWMGQFMPVSGADQKTPLDRLLDLRWMIEWF